MSEPVVRYPDRRGTLRRTLGKVTTFDKKERRWVSSPVRVYAGPRKAARA